MNKVKLTIIKDNPAATLNPNTEIVQSVLHKAAQCSYYLGSSDSESRFMFGNAVIYTHGVQAFIFEDIE